MIFNRYLISILIYIVLSLFSNQATSEELSLRNLLRLINSELSITNLNPEKAEKLINRYNDKCLSKYEQSHRRCIHTYKLMARLKKLEQKYDEQGTYIEKIMRLENCELKTPFERKNYFHCRSLNEDFINAYQFNDKKYEKLLKAYIKKYIKYNETYEDPKPYGPQIIQHYFTLASIYSKKENWEKEESTIKKTLTFLQQDTNHATPTFKLPITSSLGFVSLKLGSLNDSENYLTQSLAELNRLLKKTPTINDTLAFKLKRLDLHAAFTNLYIKLGNSEKANEHFHIYSHHENKLKETNPHINHSSLLEAERSFILLANNAQYINKLANEHKK